MIDLGKDEAFPFDAGSAQHRWKPWVRVVTPDRAWYHVYWLRVAAGAVLLLTAGWCALATGAWAFVYYLREIEEVRWSDLALYPLRRDEYRAVVGRHLLAVGKADIEKKNYHQGYTAMLGALNRLPADASVRREVAILEARFGLVHRAIATLGDVSVLKTADLDYLKLAFGWLLEAHEDARVLELAQQILPAKPDAVLTHQFVALQAATADFNFGHHDAAERRLEAWQLDKSVEGTILRAKCDWERGDRRGALERLKLALGLFPKRDDLLQALVRMHREAGEPDEARRFALLRYFNDPRGAGPRIDLLHAYRITGDAASEKREADRMLEEFGRDPKAMVLLAWHATETFQHDLMSRVVARAKAEKLDLHDLHLAQIELALVLENYPLARDLANDALAVTYEPEDPLPSHLRALRALALIRLAAVDEGEADLRLIVDKERWRASDLIHVGQLLCRSGRQDMAREFLVRAVRADPLNETALAELVRFDALASNRAGLAENLPKLLRFARPPRATLEETLLRLNTPETFAMRRDLIAAIGRAPLRAAPRRRKRTRASRKLRTASETGGAGSGRS